MSLENPVPSDLDAESFAALYDDCREVSAVLGIAVPAPVVIDLRSSPSLAGVPRARLPLDRLPLDRLPMSFGAMPAELTDDLLVGTGWLDED